MLFNVKYLVVFILGQHKLDYRFRYAGSGASGGTCAISAWNQEVSKANSDRKPLYHRSAGVGSGGLEVARGRDAQLSRCLLREPEGTCGAHSEWSTGCSALDPYQ